MNEQATTYFVTDCHYLNQPVLLINVEKHSKPVHTQFPLRELVWAQAFSVASLYGRFVSQPGFQFCHDLLSFYLLEPTQIFDCVFSKLDLEHSILES